jgi:hypothetical protein
MTEQPEPEPEVYNVVRVLDDDEVPALLERFRPLP